jgi:hypothetical protein
MKIMSIHLISPLSRVTFTVFLKTSSSLSCSQKPNAGPCTHPNESMPHHIPCFLQIQFNITFPVMITDWKESPSCIFHNKNFVRISHLPHAWCMSHHFPWTQCHNNTQSSGQIVQFLIMLFPTLFLGPNISLSIMFDIHSTQQVNAKCCMF